MAFTWWNKTDSYTDVAAEITTEKTNWEDLVQVVYVDMDIMILKQNWKRDDCVVKHLVQPVLTYLHFATNQDILMLL